MTEDAFEPRASTFDAIPDAAWAVRCDHRFPPLVPNHDKPEIVDPPYPGMPFGGFGAGTFATTYRGDFARWRLATGHHVYRRLPACAHLLAVADGARCDAFAIAPSPDDGTLGTWSFRTEGHRYAALYPRAWFSGAALDATVPWQLAGHSPVLPHDYRASSLPVASFGLVVRNEGPRPVRVAAGLSWENLSLERPGEIGGFVPAHEVFPGSIDVLRIGRSGVASAVETGSFAVAGHGGETTAVPLFDAAGDGERVWLALTRGRGEAVAPREDAPSRPAGFLGWTAFLAPGEERAIRYALAWHFPLFRFGEGRTWVRRYCRHFGRDVTPNRQDGSCRIAIEAVEAHEERQERIRAWQQPILSARPPALARALFNGLYVLADGGTAWEDGEVAASGAAAPAVPGARDTGRFAQLECFTYPYYETLDVRYYGSFPLLFFWPAIERQVLLQFAAAAFETDLAERDTVHVHEHVPRKRPGVLPHDLGAPAEDPWVRSNAYDDIDPNRWKDLGPKFVLLVARYLAAVGWEDRGFLRAVWPSVRAAMETLSSQDRDGDGLPENEGIPDQTFDKWPMTGPSAYCAGLAIASLRAASALAAWCGDPGKARAYDAWRRKAVASYRSTLWRGDTVRYDASEASETWVMAGQLSGDFGALVAGFDTTLSREETRRVLETILRSCARETEGREAGVCNGAAIVREGKRQGVDPDNRHAREVWPGIAFGVASHLVLSGLADEGTALAATLARVIYEDHPFAFNIPEAWLPDGRFRGASYMRASAVWAVEEALRRVAPDPSRPSYFAHRQGATRGDE